ncbi:MAG: hypothetical protein KBG48_25505 [Kofleriaceae bacterium]|jgi:hypothetical protein|nr:hypothetical protein [Kofleriaceae bacterium]MBP9170780.1 hypothetical protein [Kofleriaceae bacterium]MBP9857705.1 hypothetical protein [Kofleriaceae bacterium]
MKFAAIVVAVALAACGGQSPPPTTPPPSGPAPDPAPAAIVVDLNALGTACGADGACPDGTLCARYYGIAGASGPEFSSCEIACDTGQTCPAGSECLTIADGPGAVCRRYQDPADAS